MEILLDCLKKPFTKRLFILVCIGILLFLVRSQLTLLLLTFIFVFIFNSAQKQIYKLLSPYIKMERKAIIIFLYLLIVGLLFLVLYIYVPQIVQQFSDIIKSINSFIEKKQMIAKPHNQLLRLAFEYVQSIDLEKIDLESYVKSSGSVFINMVSSVGTVSLNMLLALLLSLFFLMEKEKIIQFTHSFQDSKIGWIYEEVLYLGSKFTNSFGKVIQTQIVIAFVNSTLSAIFLAILGFHNLIGLYMMIFILGMIPVAGVIISLVPLVIIAYSVGGFRYVFYVIMMIIVLHALEAYFLNPKLMSNQTKLPVFITFLVLVVSEHVLGIWGLIVGIPITMFALDVLEVKVDHKKEIEPPDDGAA